jgi:hypothetical protein
MQRPSLSTQTEDLPISNSLEYTFGSNLSDLISILGLGLGFFDYNDHLVYIYWQFDID